MARTRATSAATADGVVVVVLTDFGVARRAQGLDRPPDYTRRRWTAGPALVLLGVFGDRRVPGRPRADDHGRRPALDPRRPRRGERDVRLGGAAQGELDHQRLPARVHPDDAARRPPRRPVGRPPPGHGRAGRLHGRVGAGGDGPGPRPAHRGPARSRRSVAGSSSRSGTAAAAHLYEGHGRPRALGVIGALTFLGMAAGPFLGAAMLSAIHPEAVLDGAGLAERSTRCRARAGVALDLLRQRADRAGGVGPRVGGRARLGDAAPTGRVDIVGAALFGVALAAGLVALPCSAPSGEPLVPRSGPTVTHSCWRWSRSWRRCSPSSAALRGGGPVPRRPAVPEHRVQRGAPGVVADRVCVRDGDHRRRRVRRSGALRRPGRAATGARGAGRCHGYRRAFVGVRGAGRELPGRDPGRSRRSVVGLFAMSRWTPATTIGEAARSPRRCSGSGSVCRSRRARLPRSRLPAKRLSVRRRRSSRSPGCWVWRWASPC